MLSGNVLVEVLIYLDRARGSRPLIRGHSHKVHRAVYGDMAHEIRHEDEAALQHAHKNGLLARIVRRYLRPDLLHFLLDVYLRDQNALNVLFHYFHQIIFSP